MKQKSEWFARFNAFIDSGWMGVLKPIESAVWLGYHRHSDADGLTWPDPITIARKLGHSNSNHVRGARKVLLDHGLLVRVELGGGGESGKFRVMVPTLPETGPSPDSDHTPNQSRVGNAKEDVDPTRNRDATLPETGTPPYPKSGVYPTRNRDTEGLIEGHSEGHKEGQSRAASPPDQTSIDDFPEGLRTEEFTKAWERWEKYRADSRFRKLKPASVKQKLKELAEIGPDLAVKCIEASIGNGWQGLFPEKYRSKNHDHNGRKTNGHRAGEFAEDHSLDDVIFDPSKQRNQIPEGCGNR